VTPADLKPAPRIVDHTVYKRFHERYWTCLACGHQPVSAAHLIGKGRRGDDVPGNLIPLCGGGSSGCHGAYDNGHSYIGDFGRKVTPEIVRYQIAQFIRSEAGEDHAAYLIRKLGPFGAEAFVQRLEA
jgi:hypothetical protein